MTHKAAAYPLGCALLILIVAPIVGFIAGSFIAFTGPCFKQFQFCTPSADVTYRHGLEVMGASAGAFVLLLVVAAIAHYRQ